MEDSDEFKQRMDEVMEEIAREYGSPEFDDDAALVKMSELLVWGGERALGIKLDPGTFFVSSTITYMIRYGLNFMDYFEARREETIEQVRKMREAAGVAVIDINKEG
jgi:hypothetical protein